jgi:hypothetical protein
MGIRPFLTDLQAHLGPTYLVLAYLDDIFILGQDDKANSITQEFAQSQASPIMLNPDKCTTHSLDDIRLNGVELLGTALGGLNFRRNFLETKVAAEEVILDRLEGLPHQRALLLLRQALSLDLRHLLRTPG